MKTVTLPETLEAWRQTARQLLKQEIDPVNVNWAPASELSLDFAQEAPELDHQSANGNRHKVPAEFLAMAKDVSCHRDNRKWSMLYRILWKLTHGKPKLLKVGLDTDVVQCNQMIKAIHRDCHKMKAFVRFREIDDGKEDTENYAAWFEPEHLIVKRMAPFFIKRFATMSWSILTPDACAHWDKRELVMTQGVDKKMAPDSDDLESLWLTYYRNIFNPARLKEKAMQSEMPKKYWKNLPEAQLIPELTEKGKRMDIRRNWN
ncbi:TIGR03915 family putative DNA repair protein [Rubellicoccus peritrichatus]|uniref:TIGR03915 family putative DNA repair protein n=1 Tax=Rubellicoccus peritrichatus TaxID=3080537 RepID=A0AAQ3LD17_9BACT|nr:TIGR03915 family putative DNA repair protein [Puniceicoccus sp. CR14]WOO43475.1 TIGR03915 family putative DNA repair protein [Puniceicoccus sp. CR14]